MWEKGTGSKKQNWWVQNRQGEVKNSTGNGEAKELTCTTHEHELKEGECQWEQEYRAEGNKGEKKMGQL